MAPRLPIVGPLLRRASFYALVFECGASILVALLGFGGPFNGRWYQNLLPLTQLPGVFILDRWGLCCGYRNGLVISDDLSGRWSGLQPRGMPILFVANVVGLTLVLFVTLLALRAIATRRRPSGAPAV